MDAAFTSPSQRDPVTNDNTAFCGDDRSLSGTGVMSMRTVPDSGGGFVAFSRRKSFKSDTALLFTPPYFLFS
jgi:hypothetical protein